MILSESSDFSLRVPFEINQQLAGDQTDGRPPTGGPATPNWPSEWPGCVRSAWPVSSQIMGSPRNSRASPASTRLRVRRSRRRCTRRSLPRIGLNTIKPGQGSCWDSSSNASPNGGPGEKSCAAAAARIGR